MMPIMQTPALAGERSDDLDVDLYEKAHHMRGATGGQRTLQLRWDVPGA